MAHNYSTLAQAIKEDTSLLPVMFERLVDIAATVGKMSVNDDGGSKQPRESSRFSYSIL